MRRRRRPQHQEGTNQSKPTSKCATRVATKSLRRNMQSIHIHTHTQRVGGWAHRGGCVAGAVILPLPLSLPRLLLLSACRWVAMAVVVVAAVAVLVVLAGGVLFVLPHTHTHAHVPTDLCPLTEHGLYLQDFFTISGLADWLVGWLAGCWSGLALLLLLLCLCLWSGHISLFSCCHGFMINLNLNLESYIETLTSSSLPLPSPSEQLSFRHPSPPPSPLPSPAWSYVVLLGLLQIRRAPQSCRLFCRR